MTPHAMLTRFAGGFLIAFLIDGVLSVLMAATAGNLDLPVLRALHIGVALLVFLWAFLAYGALFLTPKLRKRLILPAVLFTLWGSLMSFFPFSLITSPWMAPIFAIVQTALGLGLVLAWKKYHQPLIDDERPGFTWGNFATGAVVSVALFFFGVAGVVITAANAIDTHTGGYASLRPSGFYLEERTFRKENKEVRLIGMMHVARASFYDSIAADLKGIKQAVVLLEGVSDEKGLLKKRLSYNKVAAFIGITAQEKSSFTSQAVDSFQSSGQQARPPVEYLHADLDISALQPQTLAVVESLSALLASQSLQEALVLLQDKSSPFNDEEGMKAAMVDLIQTRNTHLLTTLQVALNNSNLVIVPWGALHLQDMQKELEKMGFEKVDNKARQALSFSPF